LRKAAPTYSRRGMTRLSSVNLFARDLDGLISFYAGLFSLSENLQQRGPIYRTLDAGGVAIGFNAADAYRLLKSRLVSVAGRSRSMLTFETADHAAVQRLCDKALAMGATIVKPPFDTSMGRGRPSCSTPRQCVSHQRLPAVRSRVPMIIYEPPQARPISR